MKNEKNISKPKSTVRKAVAQAIDSHEKENGMAARKDSPDIQEAIRLKAYELYVERGYSHGNDVQDWLEAERIVFKKFRI